MAAVFVFLQKGLRMNQQFTLSNIWDSLAAKISMDFPMPDLDEYIPTELDLGACMKFLAIFAVGFLLLGVLGRMLLGRRSGANHALSSAAAILFVYAFTVAIYAFRPWNLENILSPLPLAAFSGEYLVLFSFSAARVNVICYELVTMLILAFLVNLLDSLIPQGKSILGWFCLRLAVVLLAMVIHFLLCQVLASYLPGVLLEYAPMILLGVLAALLALGVLNFLMGLVLATVNPILGGIYAFFFSNRVGRQLTCAVGTTMVLAGLVLLLEHFGVTVLCISQSALLACLPLLLAVLVLWYILGHLL